MINDVMIVLVNSVNLVYTLVSYICCSARTQGCLHGLCKRVDVLYAYDALSNFVKHHRWT